MSIATLSEPSAPSSPGSIDPDALYEIIGGRAVETPPMGIYECWIASHLACLLGTHVEANRLGRTFVEGLFRTKTTVDQSRRPDVAYLSKETWPLEKPVPDGAGFEIPPDLAVEVVSPTDRAVELHEKVQEYFQAGVKEVWVVYKSTYSVVVYDSPDSARLLNRADVLQSEKLLPGFRLELTVLFPDANPRLVDG